MQRFCKNRVFKTILRHIRRLPLFPTRHFSVTILGSSGGIGQTLCLLLKKNPLVTKLILYDISSMNPGVGVDLSHINTTAKVVEYNKPKELALALAGSHVVVITAGFARKPDTSRNDLFSYNANTVYLLTREIAHHAPSAIICVITSPVNSTVPIVSEVMMRNGVYDPTKIFGITTLDVVRASTFVAQMNNCSDVSCQYVPVIGGHARTTIIPLLSQSKPPIFLTNKLAEDLIKRIQEAGTEVVQAKAGGGSATLSTAFAADRFVGAVLRGLSGEQNVVECSYVSSKCTSAPYFATPVLLGKFGLEVNLGIPSGLNKYEKILLKKAIIPLRKNIQRGIDFVSCQLKGKCY